MERVLDVHPRTLAGKSHGHSLGEVRAVVGSRRKVSPDPAHHAEARRHRCEHVLEAPAARPPELVGVGVEDPVGTELDRG